MKIYKFSFVLLFVFFLAIVIFLFLRLFLKVEIVPYSATCNLNMVQINTALDHYYLEYGRPIPSCLYDDKGKPVHSWRVLLLSFLGEEELYKQYDFSEPWNGPNNSKLYDKMPSVFRCPFMKFSSSYPSYFFLINEYDNSDDKNNALKQKYLLIETNNNSINWLEPVDFPIENFDLGPEKKDGHSQLRRLCKHYKKDGHLRIYGTMTILNDRLLCLSEDTKPEALKALADPEERKRVKITYPWGEDFGIQRAELKEP